MHIKLNIDPATLSFSEITSALCTPNARICVRTLTRELFDIRVVKACQSECQRAPQLSANIGSAPWPTQRQQKPREQAKHPLFLFWDIETHSRTHTPWMVSFMLISEQSFMGEDDHPAEARVCQQYRHHFKRHFKRLCKSSRARNMHYRDQITPLDKLDAPITDDWANVRLNLKTCWTCIDTHCYGQLPQDSLLLRFTFAALYRAWKKTHASVITMGFNSSKYDQILLSYAQLHEEQPKWIHNEVYMDFIRARGRILSAVSRRFEQRRCFHMHSRDILMLIPPMAMPNSLANIMNVIKSPWRKLKELIDFKQVDAWLEARDSPHLLQPDLAHYCMRDCVCVYLIAQYIYGLFNCNEFIREFYKVQKAHSHFAQFFTLAQFAFELFRAWCSKQRSLEHYTSSNVNTFVRKAIYGGRCISNIIGRNNSTESDDLLLCNFDLNSMYPSALTAPMPTGQPQELSQESISILNHALSLESFHFLDHLPFIAHATCIKRDPLARPNYRWLPQELSFPLFPSRHNDDSLCWRRSGNAQGIWSCVDLYIAHQHGWTIVINNGYVWPRWSNTIGEFFKSIYAQRLEAKRQKNESRTIIPKILLNSIYGKLSERVHDDPTLTKQPNRPFRFVVRNVQSEIRPTEWGVFTLSYARLLAFDTQNELSRLVGTWPYLRLVYTDTDSFTLVIKKSETQIITERMYAHESRFSRDEMSIFNMTTRTWVSIGLKEEKICDEHRFGALNKSIVLAKKTYWFECHQCQHCKKAAKGQALEQLTKDLFTQAISDTDTLRPSANNERPSTHRIDIYSDDEDYNENNIRLSENNKAPSTTRNTIKCYFPPADLLHSNAVKYWKTIKLSSTALTRRLQVSVPNDCHRLNHKRLAKRLASTQYHEPFVVCRHLSTQAWKVSPWTILNSWSPTSMAPTHTQRPPEQLDGTSSVSANLCTSPPGTKHS